MDHPIKNATGSLDAPAKTTRNNGPRLVSRIAGYYKAWLVWFGVLAGIAGFAIGAIDNPSALTPLWTADAWTSLAVIAMAAVIAATAQSLSRRRDSITACVVSAVLIAAFGVAAFATVLLMAISAYALGARLLQWVHPGEKLPFEFFSHTVVGLAAWSLLLGVSAHWPINVALFYFALSILTIALGWPQLRDACLQLAAQWRLSHANDMPFPLRAVLWFAFGLHLCYAALPERYADALAMHLVVARAIQQFGLWHFDAGEYAWAVQPMGANWLFAWSYVLGGEYAAKLLNAVFLFLACGLLIEAKVLSRRLAYIAVVIAALTPLAFIETASLFTDNALTLFVVAATLFASRLQQSPATLTAAFATAAAGAIAVKLHGAVAMASIGVALLVFGGWRAILRSGQRSMLVCAIGALAALTPYIYAWYATGNPIFPYFNALFESPLYPAENFENTLYPGGISLADYFDLTFSSGKYLEGRDGAGGFAIPLLLPVGLITVLASGSRTLKIIAFTAMAYAVILLLNTRYLRYLYPVFPLLMLVLVSPLGFVKQRYARHSIMGALALGAVCGFMRIPAAGWILARIDPATAFSMDAKEAVLDNDVPARALGRIQAALGNDDSRVVIFGQGVGADIRGRPLYVSWYYPKLQALVLSVTSVEDAASALAELHATHVMFNTAAAQPEWKPWYEAVTKYGRLIARAKTTELYEFNASALKRSDTNR